MTTTAVAPANTYTALDKERAFAALALCYGKPSKAAVLLKAEFDLEVPEATLSGWKRGYREDYELARTKVLRHLEAHMAEQHQGLADRNSEIEDLAIDRLKAKLQNDEVDAKDLSAIIMRTATAQGIHIDKAQLLNGKPTARVELNPDQRIRVLRERFGLEVRPVAIEAVSVERTIADADDQRR